MRAASTLRTDRRLLPGYREVERREAIARERADQRGGGKANRYRILLKAQPVNQAARVKGLHG